MKVSRVGTWPLALVIAAPAAASVSGFKSLDIDFADPADASTKATWSRPALTTTVDGLGWDGESQATRDGWIETVPIAVGLSWRPAQSVFVRVQIAPEIHQVPSNGGGPWTPHPGNVFVRYSPDTKHWSSWQMLQQSERNPSPRHFEGRIGVSLV